ncbi:MAG: RagB/SusD family nutrient uptake outer membrane protein [Tannerellaceae bacterium]
MKIKNILSACILMAFMSGCGYLDVVPKGESVIETVDDYLGLIEELNSNYATINFIDLPEEVIHYNMDDVMNYKYPLMSSNYLWDEAFDRAKFIERDDLYNATYKRIAKLNILLDGIDDAKGSDVKRIKGKAQAHILRAYNYFVLVNVYAKPYNAETAATDRAIILRSEFNMESTPEQSSVQEVYDFIQADIEAALTDLPERRDNPYRPGKALGYALKSKVHLFKGELDAAIDAASKVFDYNVGLWDLELYADEKLSNPMAVVDFDMPECLLHYNGNNSMDPEPIHITKELAAMFEETDLRKELFLFRGPHPMAEKGALCFGTYNKVRWNVAGMRLSEVYLILAECYARKGMVQEALDQVNTLRQSRFRAEHFVPLQAKDAAEARQIVVNERRKELMLTNNSFFDMKRYTVIPEYRRTLTKVVNGEERILSPDSHLYVIPFSIEALESNPNLIQNSK